MSFGENLQALRKRNGLTQEAFAEKNCRRRRRRALRRPAVRESPCCRR